MLTSVKNRIVQRVDKLTKSGKVYIFLTPSGGYFSSLIFVLFIISLSYANSLAYLCSFLFFSVVFVSCHVTNFNLYGLKLVRLELEDFYFKGSEGKALLFIKNEGSKTRFDLEGSLLKNDSDYILEIRPGESREILLNVPTQKTGIFPFKRVDVQTSFPFGIFKSWMPLESFGEVVVIPSPLDYPLPGSTEGHSEEEGKKRIDLYREEFKEHRKYSNQNINQIDWKLYAKRGELFAKEYDSSINPTYSFGLFNALGSTEKEKFSCLTSWVLSAQLEGASFELKLKNFEIEKGSGRVHFLRCLRAIAEEVPQ